VASVSVGTEGVVSSTEPVAVAVAMITSGVVAFAEVVVAGYRVITAGLDVGEAVDTVDFWVVGGATAHVLGKY
jgi:hypothetical protein